MKKAKVINTIDADAENINAAAGEIISEECVVIKNSEMNDSNEISCEESIFEGSSDTADIEAGDEEISKKAALKEKKKERIRKTKLCKLVKKDFLKKHLDDYKELVTEPAWLCLKCGRTAKEMKSLHKPVALFRGNSDEDQTVL
ncbi:MAG: hypothetical protein WCF96_08745 [Eubacteriales bacterium]